MSKRSLSYYLMKTARVSGWGLFVVVGLFLLTGFSLCGQYGFERWISPQTALTVHKLFDEPLIALFLLHAGTTSYFALRRWGWIPSKRTGVKPEPVAPAE